jgi:hypothetical protein
MVAMSWLLLAPAATLAHEVGFVAAVFGEASLERDGAAFELSVGAEVREGDRLRTGARGRVKVLLSDDSILALGSNSDLRIETHSFSASNRERRTRIELFGGAVRALVQKSVQTAQADFEIKTGNAVAGVRGTEFVLESDAGGARLSTLSGEVEFSSVDGARTLVAAGQGSRLAAENGVLAAFALAPEDVARVRHETDAEQGPAMLALAPAVIAGDRLGGSDRAAGRDWGSDSRTEPARAGILNEGDARVLDPHLGGRTPGDPLASAWGNPVDGQGFGDWQWQWDNSGTVTGGRSIQVQIVLRK